MTPSTSLRSYRPLDGRRELALVAPATHLRRCACRGGHAHSRAIDAAVDLRRGRPYLHSNGGLGASRHYDCHCHCRSPLPLLPLPPPPSPPPPSVAVLSLDELQAAAAAATLTNAKKTNRCSSHGLGLLGGRTIPPREVSRYLFHFGPTCSLVRKEPHQSVVTARVGSGEMGSGESTHPPSMQTRSPLHSVVPSATRRRWLRAGAARAEAPAGLR